MGIFTQIENMHFHLSVAKVASPLSEAEVSGGVESP